MRKKSVGSSHDNPKTSRQTAYQRGGQREGSPHYVFLYSDDEDCGSEDIPLQPRRCAKAPPRQVEVIKVLLKTEDTLQALALRYQCTISEIKRINNIHKDNEIFAHRYIKVPVQPFSILTEKLIDHEDETSRAENSRPSFGHDEPSTSRDEQLINLISTPIVQAPRPQNRGINDIILNSVCEPLGKSVEGAAASTSDDLETDQLISPDEFERSSTPQTSAIDTFNCSGADWGLSWAHLLGVSLLLGFAGPLIYILYIAEESSDDNRHAYNRTSTYEDGKS